MKNLNNLAKFLTLTRTEKIFLLLNKNQFLLTFLLKKRKKDWLRKSKEKTKKDVNLMKKKGLQRKKKHTENVENENKLWERLNILNKEIAAIKEKKKKQTKMSATILK